MLRRKYTYTLLALLFALGLYLYEYFDTDSLFSTENPVTLSKDIPFLPSSTTGQIIQHQYYTVSYNEKYEQAEWVAYRLTTEQLANTHFKRPFFSKDNKVKTKSAHYRDYKNSGYDKGHLCPAGDRKFSKQAYDETFLMSNVAPQNHQFNAGIWNRLEQKTRYWAHKYKGIYIVTGGILTERLQRIGHNKVGVPKRFYKIIFDYTEPQVKAIAFLIPNKSSEAALYNYVVSIDSIEKLTGIDFFPALPDDLEDKLESHSTYKKWL